MSDHHEHSAVEDYGDQKPSKYLAAIILAISILAVFLTIPKSPTQDIFKGEVNQIKDERMID